MIITINIVLLLFALGSSAHTLSKIQITNGSDIYTIKEKPNSIFEIIEPKSKTPKLREIIYFKIMEKPYRGHPKKESQEQGPDFDDSERPFTNGPGFQFIDFGAIDEHKSDENDKNIKNNNNDDNENDSNKSKNDKKEEENNANDSKENKSNNNEGKSDSHENKNDSKEAENVSTEDNSDSIANKNDSNEKNTDNKKDDKNVKENDNKETSKGLDKNRGESKNINENNGTPDFTQNKVPAAVTKIEAAIQERNKQFDEAKEKYQDINKKNDESTKLGRRKRDINFGIPPPPPVLSPLNVRMLPDFIQRMISDIPALKDFASPDEIFQPINQDESRPRTYGFHLNKDKNLVWNRLPFFNQENYMNEPINDMINKEKDKEYRESNSPDSSSDVSNSDTDDNSLNSDNDSGYSAETDEANDKSDGDNFVGGVWPITNPPVENFNNFKLYSPITKEKDLANFVNKKNKDLKQYAPKVQPPTEKSINYHPNQNLYKNSKDTEPKKAEKNTPLPITKININKDLKEKIEMSFENLGKTISPKVTRFAENLIKAAVGNNEFKTFGMKLKLDNGYVWNDLTNPGNHYLVGEALDKNKVWNEHPPSSPDNFNQHNKKPADTDESPTEVNKPTDTHIPEDKGTIQTDRERSNENKSHEPTTNDKDLNQPNKESIDKDKNKPDDGKKNEGVQVALDDLLKKDEFWQWLAKWTAAFIEALNEHVAELVKKEVAKQVNKALNHKNEKEKDKIDTNNNDLINKNETIANVTSTEPVNSTNEINTNGTTIEKNNEEINNTIVSIAPEADKIDVINKTIANEHKSNKTTPADAHTIYGNAIDSDHVTNVFIFYPSADNNSTAKDIEAILGKTNNNVIVLGNPSNANKDSKAPESSANPPINASTGIYAIDKRKDLVPNTEEPKSETLNNTVNNEPSKANITSKGEPTPDKTAGKEDTAVPPKTSAPPKASNNDKGSNANVTDAVSPNAANSTGAKETPGKVEATKVVPETSAASK